MHLGVNAGDVLGAGESMRFHFTIFGGLYFLMFYSMPVLVY